jgi:signal transduction histidine kinase
MSDDLALYAELLIYLSGTFIYGFIARTLLRDHRLLQHNWPVRWAVVAVTLWYAGCLLDEVLTVLIEGRPPLGSTLDVVRGTAWLVALPLFAHAAWQFVADGTGDDTEEAQPPSRVWALLPYLGLGLFIRPLFTYWYEGLDQMQPAAFELAPRIVVHALIGSTVIVLLLVMKLRSSRDPRILAFVRWLLASLLVIAAAVVAGMAFLGPSSLWRVGTQLAGLGPALVMLGFAQRHTLLRFTVSLRTLRHFLTTVAVVLVVMLAGPLVGAGDSVAFRRLVAWTVLLAFVGGSAYSALMTVLAGRWTALRRFIEPSVPPQDLEELSRRIRTLESGENELREAVSHGLGRWLGTRARFLGPRRDIGSAAESDLWEYFAEPARPGCDRTDAPGALFRTLVAEDLWAAHPLRSSGELVDVLVVEQGAGVGVREGEREAVELILGQLAAVLELRRLAEARIAAEREAAEQARLGTLGLMAASLAHEVKNPLSSIKTLTQAIREELEAGSASQEQLDDLKVIVSQIGRLDQVTREILGFARPRSGDATDVSELVQSTATILRAEAQSRGITIEIDRLDDTGPVTGSAGIWQVAIFNLLLNAVRHAPAGTPVHVQLRMDQDGRLVFETSNAGPAIDEMLAQSIFEPFVSRGGTGLGLAMAADRVRSLGGSIELDNSDERVVFRIELSTSREDG